MSSEGAKGADGEGGPQRRLCSPCFQSEGSSGLDFQSGSLGARGAGVALGKSAAL